MMKTMKKYHTIFARNFKCHTLKTLPEVFDLIPESDYLAMIKLHSPNERMSESWVRTANQMKSAINNYGSQHGLRRTVEFAESE